MTRHTCHFPPHFHLPVCTNSGNDSKSCLNTIWYAETGELFLQNRRNFACEAIYKIGKK
jgi:hypothetical protein